MRHIDDDIDDVVFSSEPMAPEDHLGILALLRECAPAALVEKRLRWLVLGPTPSLVAVERARDDERVFLDLPDEIVSRLLPDRLVLRIG